MRDGKEHLCATHLQYTREDVLLHCGIMDPDRTATNFDAVQHEVVVLSSHLMEIDYVNGFHSDI